MKKFIFLCSIVTLLAIPVIISSCATDDEGPDPTLACTVQSITVDGSRINVSFDSEGNLSAIDFWVGTDSAMSLTYTYSSGQIDRIDATEDGSTVGYGLPQYTGSNITGLDFYDTDDILRESYEYSYSGSNVSEFRSYAYCDGNEYYIGRNVYSYDSQGNLTLNELYIDIGAALAAGFCAAPDQGSSPIFLGSVEYTYDENSNPLLGYYVPIDVEQYELSSPNNVVQRVFRDLTGAVTETQTLTYSYNTEGYPASVTESIGESRTFTYSDCD